MTPRQQMLNLYKTLLRESKKFSAYNFREYALRKVHDSFKENKSLTDKDLIAAQLNVAYRNLEVIKRQVVIGDLYKVEKLVIENILPK